MSLIIEHKTLRGMKGLIILFLCVQNQTLIFYNNNNNNYLFTKKNRNNNKYSVQKNCLDTHSSVGLLSPTNMAVKY